MTQTLDEFIANEMNRLQRFAEYWRDENAVNARAFPLCMKDGNEGAWAEHLAAFGDGADPDMKN